MPGSQGLSTPYQFQFVAAPSDLNPYVNSLYSWSTTEAEFSDWLPAYSAQLVVFIDGEACMEFGEGVSCSVPEGFFLTTLLQARRFTVRGPAKLLGLSLNFRGWAALTGLPVTAWHDSMCDLEDGLGAEAAQKFRALARAHKAKEIDDREMLDAMAAMVRDGITALPDAYETVIDRTLEWLSTSFKPDLADLYAALPYSERQVQRLIGRFFGQSPIRLIRRYRAVRAATLLSLPTLSDELEAEIRDAFYDQAHLIKEVRHFTGRTPRNLNSFDRTTLNKMLGPDGYSSVDLFGGNENEQLGRDPTTPRARR